MLLFLSGKQLFGVIAVLQHEVDAVLGKNRSAASGSAGDGDAPRKNRGPGRAIQFCVVTMDPF